MTHKYESPSYGEIIRENNSMTQRIAVISTNENMDYAFYLPIVEWAWNRLGWDVAVFTNADLKEASPRNPETKIYPIPEIENVRSGTLAQTVRHFVSDVLPKDAYIMVQDIDLIPLRPWNPDLDERTIWGWELTGKSFIPVHYTGMTGDKWYDLMDCTGDLKADMERELKANGRAYQPNWEQYWDTDWDILTQKVLKDKSKFTFIERGLVNGLPKGRIDRAAIKVDPVTHEYSWNDNIPEKWDIHCESNNPASSEKWKMIKRSIESVLGSVPDWMDSYVEDFYSKYKHG